MFQKENKAVNNQIHDRTITLPLAALVSGLVAASTLLVACAPATQPIENTPAMPSPHPSSQPSLQSTTTPTPLIDSVQPASPTETPASTSTLDSSKPVGDNPELALEISLAKDTYQFGEPISISLVLHNNANAALTVTRDLDVLGHRGTGNAIECSLKRDGQRVPGPDIRYYPLSKQDLTTLGPGEKRWYVIENLTFCTTELQPGNYQLYLTYRTGDIEHLIDAVWVSSNEVSFKIADLP
jgi:hypothetical protein